MTAQSWVETALPPGYDAWVSVVDGTHGWRVANRGRCGFECIESRNRAAWRHWTAAVLRGRWDKWRVDDDGDNEVECGRTTVQWHRAVGGHMVGRVLIEDDDYHFIEYARCYDIDEAMARFAGAVLATEGPANRGETP